ncbi:MAG: lyase family protein [Planctomycetes bacterium]|jgi:adenylosuccinate lyase|nr:lyase family protein [Planctomycetota bacterium]
MEKNLNLGILPRYEGRVKDLRPYFGYDNLIVWYVKVEIALMKTLLKIGIMPDTTNSQNGQKISTGKLLEEKVEAILRITTSEVDEEERITKHDIRALVNKLRQVINNDDLARWAHFSATSYDIIDSARALQYRSAYYDVTRPALKKLLEEFNNLIIKYHATPQIGRTHGQHAIPITVGFWLATIVSRILSCLEELDKCAEDLIGKISGPVGANNAQQLLLLNKMSLDKLGITFEEAVLGELGLSPGRISTQIVQPEPLARFLNATTLLSAVFAQFGTDCRHLMRTEIGEIREFKGKSQVGSSSMPHKANPITFENLAGCYVIVKNEYGKVLDVINSDHQRDLVGSVVMRDFPRIIIHTQMQINNLLKKEELSAEQKARGDEAKTFLARISVNEEACERNLKMRSKVVIAEPLYLLLQLNGYEKDAHKLINEQLVAVAERENINLVEALLKSDDREAIVAYNKISTEQKAILLRPETYFGDAPEKALSIVQAVKTYLFNTEIEKAA